MGKDHFFDHEFETSTGSSSPTYSSTETSSASGMESDSGSGAGSPATFLDPRGLDPWDEDPLPAGHDYSMAGTIGSAAHSDSGGLEVAVPIYWAPQQMAPQVDARQSPPHRGYMPEMQGPPPPVITAPPPGMDAPADSIAELVARGCREKLESWEEFEQLLVSARPCCPAPSHMLLRPRRAHTEAAACLRSWTTRMHSKSVRLSLGIHSVSSAKPPRSRAARRARRTNGSTVGATRAQLSGRRQGTATPLRGFGASMARLPVSPARCSGTSSTRYFLTGTLEFGRTSWRGMCSRSACRTISIGEGRRRMILAAPAALRRAPPPQRLATRIMRARQRRRQCSSSSSSSSSSSGSRCAMTNLLWKRCAWQNSRL